MPRLSIVIPCLDFDGHMEDTLVSVLQNRPDHCEVIVVTAGKYDDPYRLSDEVVFVREDSKSSVLQLINLGVEKARAEFVHVILPGTIALDGWIEAVLAHFEDPRVGSVAPMTMHMRPNSLQAVLGVHYRNCGARRVVGRGIRFSSQSLRNASILAPLLQAGFYRRDAILALGGFDEQVGQTLADAELGLAMRELGYVAEVAPESRVVQRVRTEAPRSVFQHARQSERLYRRYGEAGVSQSVLHAIVAMFDVIARVLPHWMIACIAGRLAARFESGVREQQTERMERAREFLERVEDTTHVSTVRVDFARRTAPARKRPAAAPRARRAA